MDDYEQTIERWQNEAKAHAHVYVGRESLRPSNETRLETLVSCVDENVTMLPPRMNLGSDCVIVNQCHEEAFSQHEYKDYFVRCYHLDSRGVGLSRNTALENCRSELLLFADDDIVYNDGYAGEIEKAFDDHPIADLLLFNVVQSEGRKTYRIDRFAPVGFHNYGRYPAYAIAARTIKIKEAGIKFSLLFGGGAKYSNGEDSLFLHDCLQKHLKIFSVPIEIGHEVQRKSTWFEGYTDKFFFDRGVLYHYLYDDGAAVLGLRFLIKNRKSMCADKSLGECYALLKKGIMHAAIPGSDYPYAVCGEANEN